MDYYEIRVKSHLGPGTAGVFEGFTIHQDLFGALRPFSLSRNTFEQLNVTTLRLRSIMA